MTQFQWQLVLVQFYFLEHCWPPTAWAVRDVLRKEGGEGNILSGNCCDHYPWPLLATARKTTEFSFLYILPGFFIWLADPDRIKRHQDKAVKNDRGTTCPWALVLGVRGCLLRSDKNKKGNKTVDSKKDRSLSSGNALWCWLWWRPCWDLTRAGYKEFLSSSQESTTVHLPRHNLSGKQNMECGAWTYLG